VFYGHIGHYRCETGDFTRPQPTVAITSVAATGLEGSTFTVAVDGKRSEVKFTLPGTYNLYNALAATAVAGGLGVPQTKTAEVLAVARAAFAGLKR